MSSTDRELLRPGAPAQSPAERKARDSAQARTEERPYMRLHALLYIYRARVRDQAPQELLAATGVAVAVALIFAVLVANNSIAGSAAAVIHKVIGPAQLQLRALGPEGMEERQLKRVEALPGVKQAAPVLEVPARIKGPTGKSVGVQLLGGDVALGTLDGLAHTLPGSVFTQRAVGLSRASARALHVSPRIVGAAGEAPLLVKLRGRAYRLGVSAVIGPEAGGALSEALAAAMPIESLQALSGLTGRISRVLVLARPGQTARVRTQLESLAAGRLAVAPADQDLTLLKQALRPSDQASAFFAVVAALLGFLFAFNAFLLTVPERRMAIADLRIDGTRRRAIVQMVLFEALLLGTLASLAGLAIGYGLATGVFHASTEYLAQAFVLSGQTVIGTLPAVLAFIAGVISTCAASAVLLTDLRRGRAVDAVYFEAGEPGNWFSPALVRKLSAGALALFLIATLVFALFPQVALLACVTLALATVLSAPALLAGALRLCDRIIARSQRMTILPVAVTSLRATSLRSLALAATGSLALFGSVALGGARGDLLRGISNFVSGYVAPGDIWLITPRDHQATAQFSADGLQTRLAHLPGVRRVLSFQGSYLDDEGRSLWIIAWPSGAGWRLLHGQIVEGDQATAASRVSAGGWVAVSSQLASDQHVGLGGVLELPTPSGRAGFRVAATTTNLGWPSGAVLMNTVDYRRAWDTSAPSALGIEAAPGTNRGALKAAVQHALGNDSGLEVLSASARANSNDTLASEGLGQLGEIASLLVLAAILALAAALASAVWQQRPALAALRLEGTRPARLRLLLLTESALMLATGCIGGLLAGIYGQLVMDRYLVHVTGFPVASFGANLRPFEIFGVVVLAVVVIVSLPAWRASKVSAALALDEEP